MSSIGSSSPSRSSGSGIGGGENADLDAAKKAEMRRLKKEEIKNEIMTKELENISKLRF
ncbi:MULTISPECIES: hypothetical protein [Pseudomonas]|uniref:hypothetical protein n=1 Tax=Pseudomonas TaxID=286 RepID=UPI001463EC36|nr:MULTISPECIES: hypothetical protein [Pseudomonas]MBT2373574.1 hypothetical protein [Pseudomonas fluorescens]QJI27347.1 hypothetical protein HKK55_01065 [Pseudomonas sp. ADAK18]